MEGFSFKTLFLIEITDERGYPREAQISVFNSTGSAALASFAVQKEGYGPSVGSFRSSG
jgi:hypothetical protein